ncbi:hypothetical protein [Paenibacillus sp. MMS20-IR301]|uniref:hypothetical protein n=1 Tax=Paenibacillus sp. MMS20-IR301 TaxID=2895946 RepID=UPI0028E250BD|nr:hypothetical protein [Paenibacillus sp. MMS20-IR301]WNS46937.1 hypothetical protein LOS79_14335 [Paenibacillus sp. MMS20-IR301]
MRMPPFQRYRRFSQIAAVFVLGMVVGGALYNAIYHMGYNMLWIHNQDLRIQIEQYKNDIQTLKKYNNTSTVIREIKVRTEDSKLKENSAALDPVIVKEVLSKLVGSLEPMRGRSMFDIDSDGKLARLLLEGKIYTAREKEYAVSIRTMLVMEGVLQIWVEISPAKRS